MSSKSDGPQVTTPAGRQNVRSLAEGTDSRNVTRRGTALPDRCPHCGHDPVAALHDLVAERREAWQAGVLEGHANGWQDGLDAGLERGAA